MPPLETEELHQKAILWPYAGEDEYGRVVYSDPVEIDVRWPIRRKDSETVDLETKVVVDQEIAVNSLMSLGELADWYGTGSGLVDAEICIVKEYHEVPDLKDRDRRRTVKLNTFSGRTPTRPFTGEPSTTDLVIVAAGFTDLICDSCDNLNGSHGVGFVVNELDYQELRSNYLDLVPGTGTGTCDAEWQWVVKRYLDTNIIRVELTLAGTGTVAAWEVTGAVWDGVQPLTLNITADHAGLCSWPATIVIQGVNYVAPDNGLLIVGNDFGVGNCVGCEALNIEHRLARVSVGETTLWRGDPFAFDGAQHYWECTNAGTSHFLYLFRGDRVVRAAWELFGAWDGVDEVIFSLGGSTGEFCCDWPERLTLRGT